MANPITNKVKTGKIPVIKKELDDGVIAEANNDGTIYLDKDVKDGSPLAKEAIAHEMVHMDQMARGDLNYNDDKVFWKGKEYDRDDMNEGSKQLPWEKEAYDKTKNMKKSPNKYSLSRGAIGTNRDVLKTKLRAEADKTAAIGAAVGKVTDKIPSFDEYEDTKNKANDPTAEDLVTDSGADMNLKNKNKSAMKMMANPITMKAKSSPLHIETSETREFDATVEGQVGKVKETATTKKTKKESVNEFAENCGTKANPKAESYVNSKGETVACKWADDEDFDPESEYKEETIYESAFTPETEEIKTPGTKGRANMGYYESLDSKMGAGVRGRANKRVNRKANSANRKFTRMSERGKPPINPKTGEAYTREEYIKNVSGSFEIPDAFVGKREDSTPGKTDIKNKEGETTHVYNPETKKYDPIAKMSSKNKSKAPFKMKGFSGFNKY